MPSIGRIKLQAAWEQCEYPCSFRSRISFVFSPLRDYLRVANASRHYTDPKARLASYRQLEERERRGLNTSLNNRKSLGTLSTRFRLGLKTPVLSNHWSLPRQLTLQIVLIALRTDSPSYTELSQTRHGMVSPPLLVKTPSIHHPFSPICSVHCEGRPRVPGGRSISTVNASERTVKAAV